MNTRLMSGCLAGAVLLAAPEAMAANCAKRDAVVERLAGKYLESLLVGGLQQTRTDQTIVEFWASAESGTFTILLTDPNGFSCIVAAGTDFFTAPARAAPLGTAG